MICLVCRSRRRRDGGGGMVLRSHRRGQGRVYGHFCTLLVSVSRQQDHGLGTVSVSQWRERLSTTLGAGPGTGFLT